MSGGKITHRRSIYKRPDASTIVVGGGEVVLVEMTNGGVWPGAWQPIVDDGNGRNLEMGLIEEPLREPPIVGNSWAVVP